MKNQTGVNEIELNQENPTKLDFKIEAQQQIGCKFGYIYSCCIVTVHEKTDSNYELEDSGVSEAEDKSESGSASD